MLPPFWNFSLSFSQKEALSFRNSLQNFPYILYCFAFVLFLLPVCKTCLIHLCIPLIAWHLYISSSACIPVHFISVFVWIKGDSCFSDVMLQVCAILEPGRKQMCNIFLFAFILFQFFNILVVMTFLFVYACDFCSMSN